MSDIDLIVIILFTPLRIPMRGYEVKHCVGIDRIFDVTNPHEGL